MAVYKTEDGVAFPAEAYAYVPDPQTPSSWKLRLWEDPQKKETPQQVGAAIAALSPGGFRGNRVEIPAADLAKVKEKIRAAWKRVNPDKDPQDMPEHLKEATLMAAEIKEDFVKLEEAAVKADGTMTVKHISPGWGMTGYYPPEMLKENARKFQPGTLMFWDHPTRSEEWERPERSLRDVAAVVLTEGKYLEDGIAGPGIYSEVKVMPQYREAIEALGPHIGLSVFGPGKAKFGEREGRQGKIIEAIGDGIRSDFVTRPGAGGKIVELWESYRPGVELASSPVNSSAEIGKITLAEVKRQRPDLIEELRAEIKEAVYGDLEKKKEERQMSEEKLKELEEKLKEAETDKARLAEVVLLREAQDLVADVLKEQDLPDLTRERLRESLSRSPVIKDGELDRDAYKEKITEAVKAEVEYLSKLSESGKIKDLGGSSGEPSGKVELKESFKLGYRKQGYSEEEAERLAGLAADGRW
jgi:hypothetical protein